MRMEAVAWYQVESWIVTWVPIIFMGLLVFFIFALGFVILTLPIGVGFTEMSRRLAVKR